MAVADRHDLPVAASVESATTHEMKLVVPTFVGNGDPRARNIFGDHHTPREWRDGLKSVPCLKSKRRFRLKRFEELNGWVVDGGKAARGPKGSC
jgi:hypothetical protein